MTSYARLTASIAFSSVAVLGLAACSSGSSSTSSPSSAAASSAASTAASPAASAAASEVASNIAPELIATYFSAACTASEENDGLGGVLSANGTTCTAADGTEITSEFLTEYLDEPEGRYALLTAYYETVGEGDVADCITVEDFKKLGVDDMPAVSYTCVINVMNSTLEILAKK
jgi:hypothetical protein